MNEFKSERDDELKIKKLKDRERKLEVEILNKDKSI